MTGLVFHVSIFCLHQSLYKIHAWKLFDFEKIFAPGKIKSGKKSLVKKKKYNDNDNNNNNKKQQI